MADDEKQLLEEARKRPLGERASHKLWKARVEVYEEMKSKCEKVFSEEDPLLDNYGAYLSKAVIDTNAAALLKGLEFTIEYLKKCTVQQAAKACDKVMNGVITKALGGRSVEVAKAVEVSLLFVEDEQGDKVAEAFISKGFVHRIPKVLVVCVDVVLQCVRLFGTKVMTPQPILKALPPLFDSKDEKIRSKVKELVVELAKWIGANPVKTILFEKMRDAMKEDVEKLIAKIPQGRPAPERLTRRQQAKQLVQEQTVELEGDGPGPSTVEAEPEEEEIDDYDLADPSEVVNQLPRDWWGNLQEKKWSIRKGALTSLKNLASKPRLATGDFSEINRELKKIILKDSNVQCVAEALWCVAALAKGLRTHFPVAKSYCSMLLEKFKEKNMSVCRACTEALTNLQKYCFALIDVQDDVLEALKHQNPKVKQCTLEWMKVCVDGSTKQITAKLLPVYNGAIAGCTDDATPLTRERAMDVIVAFCMKATSAAAIDKITAKLDDTRKKKLDELLKEARGAKSKPVANSKPAESAPPKAPAAAPSSKKDASTPMDIDKPPAKSKSKKPGNSKPSSSKSAATSKPAGMKSSQNYLADVDEDSLKSSTMTKEGAERGFTELFGEEVVTGLNSSVWKERLAGLEAMYEKLPSLDLGQHGTLLIQGISQLPGWTEKIFQVMGKVFEVIKFVAEKSQVLSKSDAYAAMTGLVEKIADIKLKTQSQETLLFVCEHVGLHFVFSVIYSLAKKNKNPKVLSEGLNWMKSAIQEFGLGPWIDAKAVINWVVEELKNTIPAVKNSAVGLIGSMHQFIGPPLADMIRPNVKPALMTTIEAEFGKNAQNANFVANRKIRGAQIGGNDVGVVVNVAEEEEPAPVFNPDDILPRADISPEIDGKIAAQLNNSNWKERKEAMDALEKLLVDSGNRIQPTVGDLFPALKGRFSDANKNLIAQAIKLFAKLATAMGKAIEKQGKSILEPALLSLSDAKPVVRGAVIELMDAWCAVASPNLLLPDFIHAIASTKSHVDGKKDALVWLTKSAADGVIGKDCLENTVKACAVGLNDKAGQVREASTELLKTLIAKNKDAVIGHMSSVESGLKGALQEAAQKITGSASTSVTQPTPVRSTPEPSSSKDRSPAVKPGKRKSKTSSGGNSTPPKPETPTTEAPALFVMSNHKEDRAYNNRGKRAKFEGATAEEEASLKSEMEPYVAPHLHALLFASDFKKHCTAADMIKDALNDYYTSILASLDFVFRWAVLRIFQGKIQCLTSVLQMLKSVFEKLASENYRMSEHEATILLPCIVEKSGHNQDRIKKYHREIICLATTVYSPAKIFTFVSQGLVSKNTRTKVESIEEIGSMIDRDGMKIASGNKQSKALEEIAALVADRDKAIRAACLSSLTVIYDFEGTRIWKLLGKISAQQRSLVEERFKSHQRSLSEKGLSIGHRGSRPSTPTGPPTRLPTPDGTKVKRKNSQLLDTGSTTGDVISRPPSQISGRSLQSPMPSLDLPDIQKPHLKEDSFQFNNTQSPSPMLDAPDLDKSKDLPQMAALPTPPELRPVSTTQARTALRASPVEMSMSPMMAKESTEQQESPQRTDSFVEESWSRAMITIQSEDREEMIDSLKIICYELDQAKSGSPATVQLMKDSADELVKELIHRVLRFVSELFEAIESGYAAPSERPCKYSLNTLIQTFLSSFMAPSVEKDTMLEVVSSLLQLLLDDRLTKVAEGHTIVKGMNVLMLKILEMSHLNTVIGVLIFLLRSPSPKILQSQAETQHRFFNLVVKCLIKATKRMGTLLEAEHMNDMELNIGDILVDIHDFFERLGPDELRRRGELDDKPLRMVKTILYELCKHKGGDIAMYLDSIPRNVTPPPIILAYIDVNLQTLHSTGVLKGPPPPPVNRGQTVIQEYFSSIDRCSGDGQGGQLSAARDQANGAATDPSAHDLKTRLAIIFKKIGDKKMTQVGLEDLYQFQQEHPEVDVKPFLKHTSTAFRSYIENGLKVIQSKRENDEPDPMEIDGTVEHIEDTPITWAESADGRYLPADASENQQPQLHQPVNT